MSVVTIGEDQGFKCDDCGYTVTCKYGRQPTGGKRILCWDGDIDLCEDCFQQRQKKEESHVR